MANKYSVFLFFSPNCVVNFKKKITQLKKQLSVFKLKTTGEVLFCYFFIFLCSDMVLDLWKLFDSIEWMNLAIINIFMF